MSTDKTGASTIDEYIAAYPAGIRQILKKIRRTIQDAAPEAQETIKYRMPTFTQDGNLVSFAAYKNHIGLYPIPAGNEKFQKDISTYRTEKSTVRLPLDKPIPYELITRLVKFRLEENRVGAAGRGRKK
jgi:uncharacterized protein YdhG (YjbR/CyaY superfamily)